MAGGQGRVLVVGAGLAGAVAARELADAGWLVDVIDKRPHIAGNCFDLLDKNGVRFHSYGPHLLHTSNKRVVAWLSRFTEWLPYEHRVSAALPDGRVAPLPVNRRTIEFVTGTDLPDETAARDLLESIAVPIENPANAEEYLWSKIGIGMTELLFSRYTFKMWGLSLRQMDAAVVQRIPIRLDLEDRYFPKDIFQALPKDGYTKMFDRILGHDNISVRVNVPFEHGMLVGYGFVFLCMPIDEFFEFRLGRLPYRSIRFHHTQIEVATETTPTATVNYTDTSPITRTTYWHRLPGHWNGQNQATATSEEPCADHENGFERYYPVRTADGVPQQIYAKYAATAKAMPGFAFIGRCGTYQYLDMHQVVQQTLVTVRKWIARASGRAFDDTLTT